MAEDLKMSGNVELVPNTKFHNLPNNMTKDLNIVWKF